MSCSLTHNLIVLEIMTMHMITPQKVAARHMHALFHVVSFSFWFVIARY